MANMAEKEVDADTTEVLDLRLHWGFIDATV